MNERLNRQSQIYFGSMIGVVFVIAGLWLWQSTDRLVVEYQLVGKPAAVSFRYWAVAAVSLGEAIFVWLVIGNVWRRDWLTTFLGAASILVSFIALVGALALQIVGR